MSTQAKLPLERTWSIGSFASYRKNQWSPREMAQFNTVQDFWACANRTIFNKKAYFAELWFFEQGLVPEWSLIKNKDNPQLSEFIIKNANDEIIMDCLLELIGETLPFSESVRGLRVKNIRRGKEVRFWISGYKNVDIISNHVKKEFERWKGIEFNRTDF
jgi:hypothetical protein